MTLSSEPSPALSPALAPALREHAVASARFGTDGGVTAASFEELVRGIHELTSECTPAVVRAVLHRFADFAAGPAWGSSAHAARGLIADSLLKPLFTTLRERGELWSPEVDQVVCALEASVTVRGCPADSTSLTFWLSNDVAEGVEYLDAPAVARFLEFRSDALAQEVLLAAEVWNVPRLGDLVLAHSPWVAGVIGSNEIEVPPRVHAMLVRALRDRLRGNSEATPAVCESARALVSLLSRPIEITVDAPYTSDEIRHLGHLALDASRKGMGRLAGGSGCANLIAKLIEEFGSTVDVENQLDLYDAGHALLVQEGASPACPFGQSLFPILGSSGSDANAVIERARLLSADEWRVAAPFVAENPGAFASRDLRDRARTIDDPGVHFAVAKHAQLDELAESLRWLLEHSPNHALSAIECRREDAVRVLDRADVMPLLKLEGAIQRTAAISLIHEWA